MAELWTQNDLKTFYNSLVRSGGSQSYIEPIVSFCLAYCGGNIDRATQIREESGDGIGFRFWFRTCCVLFGAERDLRLVKYVVENEGVSRAELLTQSTWRLEVMQQSLVKDPLYLEQHYSLGRNALHFAMDSGREDVATYLLQEWLQSDPISVHLNICFNSQRYFDTIFQQPPNDLSWEGQCAWYFCKRYVLQKLPEQDVPLEELKEVTMRELEMDENFLLACVRVQGENPDFRALWELYGHHPALFHEMMDLNQGLPLQYFLPLGHSNLISPQRREMLSNWCRQTLSRTKVLAEAILLIQEDWDQFENHWRNWAEPTWTQLRLNQDLPFSAGLRTIARELHERVLKREAKKAINFMSELNTQLPANQSAHSNQLNQKSQILYLLAVAGSGKTRRMFDLLEQNLGFYFVSSAVPSPAATPDGELLYLPRSSVTSRDAQLLFRTRPSWKIECTRSSRLYENAFQDRAIHLLDSRWRLFSEIISQSAQSQFLIQPGHWLRYQLSLTRSPDPFQSIFHCAILRGDRPENSSFRRQGVEDMNFLWCFDEVQCDTDRILESPTGTWTMLSSLVCALGALNGQQCGILCGTAMNLKMIKKQVNSGIGMVMGYTGFPPDIPVQPLGKLTLVKDDETLKALISPSIASVLEGLWNPESTRSKLGRFLVADESIFTNDEFIASFQQQKLPGRQFAGMNEQQVVEKVTNYFKSVEVWNWIAYRAAALRGRHRWSVLFIERLFQLYVILDGLNADCIHRASVEVETVAKRPLIRRMRNLETSADSDRNRLAKDIFEMAMQASLFGRSRILPTSQAQILIEEALGYVESVDGGNLKVRLVEKLVVDAIMEYHFSKTPNVSLVDGYLGTWQYRPSSFGFIAEDRLAEAIYINAIQDQDVALRRTFLSNFDSVYLISAQGRQGPIELKLGDYVLECNPGPGAPKPDGDGDVGVWLDQVPHGAARETFLLPKEASGPDLMFVLRKDVSGQVYRLVCAVQSKVVRDLTIDEGVLDTVDPDRWYNGSTKLQERANFLDSLYHFKSKFLARSSEFVHFLGILVSACTENSVIDLEAIVEKRDIRKKDPRFAHGIVKREESRKKEFHQKLLEAKKKLQKAEQMSPKDARSPNSNPSRRGKKRLSPIKSRRLREIKVKEKQIAEAAVNLRHATAVEEKVESTDYYLKILDNSMVQSTFGETFYRLLQGTKGKPLAVDPSNGTPAFS